MKKVYFVRHGESERNAGGMVSSNDTSLTDKGREQAVAASERCAKLPIEIILSSEMNRAKETAEIISQKIGTKVEFFPFLHERRRPSSQMNRTHSDPEYLKIQERVDANFDKPGWRHSDEENFDDLKARALKILNLLESREEENILVIAHGFILRLIIACVIMGPELTPTAGYRFIKTMRTENSGITILNYDKDRKETPWRLWVYNDHAHLG